MLSTPLSPHSKLKTLNTMDSVPSSVPNRQLQGLRMMRSEKKTISGPCLGIGPPQGRRHLPSDTRRPPALFGPTASGSPASFSASDSEASSSPSSSSELELLDSLLSSSVRWDLGVSSSQSIFSLLKQRRQSERHSERRDHCLSSRRSWQKADKRGASVQKQ